MKLKNIIHKLPKSFTAQYDLFGVKKAKLILNFATKQKQNGHKLRSFKNICTRSKQQRSEKQLTQHRRHL